MGIFSSKQEAKEQFTEEPGQEDAFSESIASDSGDIDAIASPLDIKL